MLPWSGLWSSLVAKSWDDDFTMEKLPDANDGSAAPNDGLATADRRVEPTPLEAGHGRLSTGWLVEGALQPWRIGRPLAEVFAGGAADAGVGSARAPPPPSALACLLRFTIWALSGTSGPTASWKMPNARWS